MLWESILLLPTSQSATAYKSDPAEETSRGQVLPNEIFELKHRLKESLNHYNDYVQEQLTKAMSRAIYRMKEAGFRVSTFESPLLYTHDGKHGVINSLAELPSKLGWDRAKMKKNLCKIAINNAILS